MKVVATNWKMLKDKQEQVKARGALTKAKGIQANLGKHSKIKISCNKNHTKGSASHGTYTKKLGGGKIKALQMVQAKKCVFLLL